MYFFEVLKVLLGLHLAHLQPVSIFEIEATFREKGPLCWTSVHIFVEPHEFLVWVKPQIVILSIELK